MDEIRGTSARNIISAFLEHCLFLRASSTNHVDQQKHTLLCLMAKNMHLDEKSVRNEEERALRRHSYMNVATALNTALNGETGSFERDIDKREVAKMIDRMLQEKKGVVGKGGYMERATMGRITRGLKRMWERGTRFDYDGSMSGRARWRKRSEKGRTCNATGSTSKREAITQAVEKVVAPGISPIGPHTNSRKAKVSSPESLGHVGHQVGAGTSPVSNLGIARSSVTRCTGKSDSFNRLPPQLKSGGKHA